MSEIDLGDGVALLTKVDPELKKLPIHTSDRITYKNCRRRWYFSSKLRMNLAPISYQSPLDLGTGVHRGLELYYEPSTWSWHKNPEQRQVLLLTCISGFKESMRASKSRYEANKGPMDEEVAASFEADLKLGEAMLWNYFEWAPAVDNFVPVRVEQGFEVPIKGLSSSIVPVGYVAVYRGRLDLLVQDQYGKYWIIDHKTTARWANTDFLDLDEQCGSYAWALQEILGIKIEGVIYNELYKLAPAPPQRLKGMRKGCIFSVSKTAGHTYELYMQTLKEEFGDKIPSAYDEHLQYLATQPSEVFRRTVVYRSEKQLSNLGKQIALEAAEMLDPNTSIYPNPSRYGCSFCAFRTPCLAMNDDSDIEWILKENYKQSTHH